MQPITKVFFLRAASGGVTAFTAHQGHQQLQQLTVQGHYRHHVGRANNTGVNPTLTISNNKPAAHADHTGCGASVNNAVAKDPSPASSSTLHPPSILTTPSISPDPTAAPAVAASGVRPAPSGSGVLVVPTGGVRPAPFVYVSGAGAGVRAAAAAVWDGVVVAGIGLGVVGAVFLL
ncbi:predicted protein [Chaetomium globosum CBS 148.51]|uniref:Uncharacterized protein n=1 Tax=Chaetomium globosum (strain ATCC 6205 / CBS 148.51 / DSM 1962 / NBRC 6347 / NRRL 1970) TaxID=306901 RepID=Q2H0M0_CHAGB|nr:uncharacterized protein CHGG_04676 [Chaetomium globosum CBS 148.51]EAQ88057.1 predicted protein [Chaetomium globosum CBS 148.51]